MIRRVAPAVLALCAVAAAGGLTACGGGGTADGKPKLSASAKTTGAKTTAATAPATKAPAAATPAATTPSATRAADSVLDGRQLTSLLVGSTDVGNFTFTPVKEGAFGSGIDLGMHLGSAASTEVKPAACQPLQNLTGFDSDPDPHAFAEQKAVSVFTYDGELGLTMSLASFAGGGAHQVIAGLTAALHSCRQFTVSSRILTVAYGHLTQVRTPDLGDEAVSFRLTQTVDDHKSGPHTTPVVFTVVRTGKVIAAFYTTTPDVPGHDLTHSVIEPQVDVLALP
ncbi:hypothetical protein [Streptomyces sp. CA-111067]|uniref:hypothetical protein n=1 Tax=Streptomyces sp. CA-111067 TaxID=3240046 RepID=UPI003D981742